MVILVGSTNASKIDGVKEAFDMFFEDNVAIGEEVNSLVADEPVNKDTMRGAKNRVKGLIKHAKKNNINADFYVAIESGLINIYGSSVIMNACYIVDNNGNSSYAFSEGFPIPEGKFEDIKTKGLAKVIEEIFNDEYEPNAPKVKGGINKLTNGKVERMQFAKNATVMALTKFLNPKWR